MQGSFMGTYSVAAVLPEALGLPMRHRRAVTANGISTDWGPFSTNSLLLNMWPAPKRTAMKPMRGCHPSSC